MKDTFRYFIRKNFPEIGDMSNEEIDQIGVEFHNHLDTKLNDEQKKRVLPKSALDVIMNSEHPFKTCLCITLHSMGKRAIGGTAVVLVLTNKCCCQ
jgi:hypothetical protein